MTATVRNAARTNHETVLEKDAFALSKDDLSGFDVVINAFGAAPGQEQQHVELGQHLIKQLQGTRTRLLVVGGAGSLYVNPQPTNPTGGYTGFPDASLPTAKNQAKNLEDLQQTDGPALDLHQSGCLLLISGRRPDSSQYQLAHDINVDSGGESYVSYRDYAVAVADEVEHHRHDQQRISIVSK